MRHRVCVLTRRLEPELVAYYGEVPNSDVTFVVDDGDSGPQVYGCADAHAVAEGFVGLVRPRLRDRGPASPTAWDKCLRLLLSDGGDPDPRPTWIIEDDVFARDPSRLSDVFAAAGPGADLVTQRCLPRRAVPDWPHWDRDYTMPEVWSAEGHASFNPICRLSRRLLDAVDGFRRQHGCLCYHEVLFASLAHEHGLACEELEGCGNVRHRPEWSYRASDLPDTVLHPVKDWPGAAEPRGDSG